jgi:hypothetical protein
VRKEAFLAYKEHKLSQARKDEHWDYAGHGQSRP